MAMDLASYIPPSGFKFRLSSTEIISELQLRNSANHHQVNPFIPTVDIFNTHPSEIPGIVRMPWEDEEWHVFSKKRGKCVKRKAKSESWNITGKVKEIIGKDLNADKTILVRKGVKTDFVIHEFALQNQSAEFVMCILKKKTKKNEGTKKSKRAKTLASSSPESLSIEPVSGLELPDTPEIAKGHNQAQFRGEIRFENNLPCLNEGEASSNVTSDSEISPTANSMISVDDYTIEECQEDTPFSYVNSNSNESMVELMSVFCDPDENSFRGTSDDTVDKSDGLSFDEVFNYEKYDADNQFSNNNVAERVDDKSTNGLSPLATEESLQ